MKNTGEYRLELRLRVGRVIKKLRLERGLNQESLAIQIGLENKGSVSRMENEGRGALEHLEGVARVLGLQATDVISLAENGQTSNWVDPTMIKIPLLNAVGSLGDGTEMRDDIVVGELSIQKDWITKEFRNTWPLSMQ